MNRQKALDILPAIVDNEVSTEEQAAFFDFIEHDDLLRKEYEEALLIKKLLKSRYKRTNAPEDLTGKIQKIITTLGDQDSVSATSIYDIQENKSNPSNSGDNNIKRTSGYLFRYLTAAAVVLFITFVTIQLLDRTTTYDESFASLFIVENVAAEHFLKSNGQLIEPHFGTHSVIDAEEYLRDHFGMVMTVPKITGAQFEGIVMADFIDGFQTPLLEYTQAEIGETIYLFAFDLDKVLDHDILLLQRHNDAVAVCNTQHDFFVAEVNKHHVVSWLWDNTWYSAISNHNGYDLAGLVEPLQYNR